MRATQVRRELAGLALAAGPVTERAEAMLDTARRLVPCEAAWVARADLDGYASVAGPDLADDVVQYLAGPKMAHDIEVTGVDRVRPPLSASDLPYPAEELPTWTECLFPAGLHEALAVALYEPGGRRIGFLALLFADSRPPSSSARRRLASIVPLIAEGLDPLRSATAAARLVSDAFAGALVLGTGSTAPLPGLAVDARLQEGSSLLDTVRSRLLLDEPHSSFLWPDEEADSARAYVRVTFLTASDPPADPVHGIVLLSPPGALHGLTHRELEVLGMMIDGCSNQQIAERLFVATRTVAAHVEHILLKLGSPSRTHAAVRAQREGVFIPDPSRC